MVIKRRKQRKIRITCVVIYGVTEMAREKVRVHLLVIPNTDMSMFPPLTPTTANFVPSSYHPPLFCTAHYFILTPSFHNCSSYHYYYILPFFLPLNFFTVNIQLVLISNSPPETRLTHNSQPLPMFFFLYTYTHDSFWRLKDKQACRHCYWFLLTTLIYKNIYDG